MVIFMYYIHFLRANDPIFCMVPSNETGNTGIYCYFFFVFIICRIMIFAFTYRGYLLRKTLKIVMRKSMPEMHLQMMMIGRRKRNESLELQVFLDLPFLLSLITCMS